MVANVIIGTNHGGTGLTSIGTANQVLTVKADLSGLEYTTPEVGDITEVIAGTGLTGTGTMGPIVTLNIDDTGVFADTYAYPVNFEVNAQGQITSAESVPYSPTEDNLKVFTPTGLQPALYGTTGLSGLAPGSLVYVNMDGVPLIVTPPTTPLTSAISSQSWMLAFDFEPGALPTELAIVAGPKWFNTLS